MNSAANKPFIDKCIISFSHDRIESRDLADRMSIEKAEREIAAGKKGISHLILRAINDDIDRLKFLFLINGIPLLCYAMGNLLASSLKEIVVIGSEEVERVLDRFLEMTGSLDKKVTFVREDPDNLSLSNTLALGRSRLSLDADEMILFQPGDLPFLYDLEKVLRDETIRDHNLILWLNSKQQMFPGHVEDENSEFVQRNYHYRGIFENPLALHDIKEPNVYPINLTRVDPNIINRLHSMRKDGKIFNAGLKQALDLPVRLIRILPALFDHLRHFRTDLKRLRPNDVYQFGMHQRNFNRAASILLGTPLATKLHGDPAFVSDVDALEDWQDFEGLTLYAREQNGDEGLGRIHPFGDALTRFKEEAMPGLQRAIPMYADFPAYMNRLHRTLRMPQPAYDAHGNFVAPPGSGPRMANAHRWYLKTCERLKVRREERCSSPESAGPAV